MGVMIDRLRREHLNLEYLVEILGRQLESFGNGGTPDLRLMRELAEYLTDYADPYHHDTEDHLLRCVLRDNPRLAAERPRFALDHRNLAILGREIRQTLDRIINGEFLPRDELFGPGSDYLRMYRRHLERERRLLLGASGRLESAEKAALQREFPLIPDPLETLEDERFRLLYDAISVYAKQARADADGELTCPACDIG